MPDSTISGVDLWLDRLSKLAGILLPVIIGVVGGIYTLHKDKSDGVLQAAAEKRNKDEQEFDKTQKQYTNLAALLPLLTSGKEDQARMAVQIYTSEAHAFQAPTDLQGSIEQLKAKFPDLAAPIQAASDAGHRQLCNSNPDGLYLQVANDSTQLTLGKALGQQLTSENINPPVQGVQRIDQGPRNTELRYYFSARNNNQADDIIGKLKAAGIQNVKKVDMSARYLKAGCAPPAVYELWIGTSAPLVSH